MFCCVVSCDTSMNKGDGMGSQAFITEAKPCWTCTAKHMGQATVSVVIVVAGNWMTTFYGYPPAAMGYGPGPWHVEGVECESFV